MLPSGCKEWKKESSKENIEPISPLNVGLSWCYFLWMCDQCVRKVHQRSDTFSIRACGGYWSFLELFGSGDSLWIISCHRHAAKQPQCSVNWQHSTVKAFVYTSTSSLNHIVATLFSSCFLKEQLMKTDRATDGIWIKWNIFSYNSMSPFSPWNLMGLNYIQNSIWHLEVVEANPSILHLWSSF